MNGGVGGSTGCPYNFSNHNNLHEKSVGVAQVITFVRTFLLKNLLNLLNLIIFDYTMTVC